MAKAESAVADALSPGAEAQGGLGESPAPPERLARLRVELARLGVDGFVVPLTDEFQNEFPPRSARRLEWLSGFSGSAGVAVVLAECAAIFVDGRYAMQVRAETDQAIFEPCHLTERPPADWLRDNLPRGGRLGYDPWLHSADGLNRLETGVARVGGEMVALEPNPVDGVWDGRPAQPSADVVPHDLRYAGRPAADKRGGIAASLFRDGVDAAVLTAPDSIAWLLNIRGGDVPHAPLPLGYAIIAADGTVELFMEPGKLASETISHLGDGVTVTAIDGFGPALDTLGAAAKRVLLSKAAAPVRVSQLLKAAGAVVVPGRDPCVLPKACKNDTELAGARAAHIRDGAALVRFLAWLAAEAPRGHVDELGAEAHLDQLRAKGEMFRGLSFNTISGAGANGAIVHYRATAATNRKLEPGTLYLVDSGAQYLDGTTDVTRTVAIGEAADEPRDRFTRVLKGHIAVASARFPAGTAGSQLDVLARRALWQVGLDFDHGTGHGVGSYLNVHEGPQRIAKRGGDEALKPGMIVSNEPGYYKPDGYGIRIENLIAVRGAKPGGEGEKDMLEFETLTLAPIDRNLIEHGLMTAVEISWLDAYHARVLEVISPLVDKETAAWLKTATAPLGD